MTGKIFVGLAPLALITIGANHHRSAHGIRSGEH